MYREREGRGIGEEGGVDSGEWEKMEEEEREVMSEGGEKSDRGEVRGEEEEGKEIHM